MPPIIKPLDESQQIYKNFEENFSEYPLKLWSRSSRFCTLKLRDPNVIIRVKLLIYTRQDIDEFDIQTQELLERSSLKKLLVLTLAQLSWEETMLKSKEVNVEWWSIIKD